MKASMDAMVPGRGAISRARRTVLASLACGLCLAAGLPGLAAPAMPRDLAQALDAYDRATIGKDTATLSGLVTDDYLLVNSDASVQDKRSYLADFAVAGFRLDPYVVEAPIHRVQGDAALTGGTFRLSWVQDGKSQTRHLRISHFWIRQGGRWRISYTQLTRIPDPA